MNTPNSPLPALDLAQHVHMGVLMPFWMQAAHGHYRYAPSALLCPVCGSPVVAPPDDDSTSVFIGDKLYEVNFHRGTVTERGGSEGLNIFCVMLHLRCENGHNAVLNFHMDAAEAGMTFEVQIDEEAFAGLFPAAHTKWNGDAA